MRRPLRAFLLVIAACSAASAHAGGTKGEERAPYPFNRLLPSAAIGGYRLIMRPSRSGRCPMYPSCSHFSEEAFHELDPLTALVRTADRLIRCGHDLGQYGRVAAGGRMRYLDPVHTQGQQPVPEEDGRSAPAYAPVWTASQDSILLRFALQLKGAGDLEKAVVELKRLISYYPASPLVPHASKALLDCYYDSGRYQEGLRLARGLTRSGLQETGSGHLGLYTGKCLIRQGRFIEGLESLEPLLESDDGMISARAMMLSGYASASIGRWEGASEYFASAEDFSTLKGNASLCRSLSLQGPSLPRKNPALAGILAVVPGLGYLYDGYPHAALSALLVNAVFMWGTYESFESGNEGTGTVLAVMSAGWYAGNIYGSAASAGRRNEQIRSGHLARFDLGFEF